MIELFIADHGNTDTKALLSKARVRAASLNRRTGLS